jgi:RNA polymerase sigma factor (sigma-70 family)
MTILDAPTTIALEQQVPVEVFPLDLTGSWAWAKNRGVAVREALQETRETTVKRAAGSLDQASDEELIAAITEGEDVALELLYERYERLAYALAYRLVHDCQVAEDIVQEAFLAIWRKAGTYRTHHGSVYNWLLSIVRHRAIDRLRSASNRKQLCAPLDVEIEQYPLCTEPDACDQVWQSEQRRLVLAALAQIPEEQRQVIDLAYFDGYTHAEIAEMLHLPLGTVKGRMRLGLQKLKVLLEKSGMNEH